VGGIDEAADDPRVDDIGALAVVRRLEVERRDAVRAQGGDDAVRIRPRALGEEVNPRPDAAVDRRRCRRCRRRRERSRRAPERRRRRRHIRRRMTTAACRYLTAPRMNSG